MNLGKGVKYAVLFGLAFLVTSFVSNFPAIADVRIVDLLIATIPGKITVGALLVMLVNWLKIRWNFDIP